MLFTFSSKKGREFHLWTKDWDREMEKIEEDNTKDIEQKDNTDEINLEVKTEGSEIKDVVTEVEVKTEPDVTEIEIKVEADLEEPVTDHQSQNGDQTNKDRAVESTAENMETESQKLGKENDSKEQMNGVKEETPPDEESNTEKAREVVGVTLQEAAEQGKSIRYYHPPTKLREGNVFTGVRDHVTITHDAQGSPDKDPPN